MGVNPLPTGGIYKYFTFDGETSASFGVHITGEGVFNAPKRAVEMINIPARNGAFALDQGYFENIEVTYNASIVAETNADFAAAVSGLRNFLCSRTGYCRLEDDYNPNEYRMAVYKSGLEVTPFVLKTGEFQITFDCKPQRFLKSGETAVAITSGDTITNPTLFEARPMLEVEGYGGIIVNGETINIEQTEIGELILSGKKIDVTSITLDLGNVNTGDDITVSTGNILTNVKLVTSSQSNRAYYRSSTFTDGNALFETRVTGDEVKTGLTYIFVRTSADDFVFQKGTDSTITNNVTGTIVCENSKESGTYNVSFSATQTVQYVSATSTFKFILTASATTTKTGTTASVVLRRYDVSQIVAYSTVSALGHPTYIDCDIGECYMISNGEVVPLNDVVTLPPELPILSIGETEVTYDNTVTDFKIVPRWWEV